MPDLGSWLEFLRNLRRDGETSERCVLRWMGKRLTNIFLPWKKKCVDGKELGQKQLA